MNSFNYCISWKWATICFSYWRIAIAIWHVSSATVRNCCSFCVCICQGADCPSEPTGPLRRWIASCSWCIPLRKDKEGINHDIKDMYTCDKHRYGNNLCVNISVGQDVKWTLYVRHKFSYTLNRKTVTPTLTAINTRNAWFVIFTWDSYQYTYGF